VRVKKSIRAGKTLNIIDYYLWQDKVVQNVLNCQKAKKHGKKARVFGFGSRTIGSGNPIRDTFKGDEPETDFPINRRSRRAKA
jgi:hypothetical protein